MISFYAHSLEGRDKSLWQLLSLHLLAVAAGAGRRGAKFGMARAAALGGLLHDLGKYCLGFARRLEGGAPVDHATAGAQEVLRLATAPQDRLIAELLAYGIAGHHAGLADREGLGGSLDDRLAKSLEPLDPVWRAEIQPDASGLAPPSFKPHPDRNRQALQLAFLGRMLFSCLVDADYRDTEAFYAGAGGYLPDRDWPLLQDRLDGMIAAVRATLEEKQRSDGAVNRLRQEILEGVLARAALSPGLFTLTVPTGGGKTLASLAFALAHARAWGLERVIFAIPFTSVIDQSASIFKGILGEELVLEHHSALEEDKLLGRDARDKLRLAMEDWAAPVVVTTTVQLFESLYANRPSRCRKLHNLAKSVIVLDEAQTLPLPLLRPCVAALEELALNYGASIVLCTATQPALTAAEFPGRIDLGPERELAPDPPRLYQALRRVTLQHAGEMGDAALVEALAATPRGLVIVNSRAHALALYRLAGETLPDGLFHLSTRQYAAHRRRILDEIRRRLKERLPCRVVSTSLVEAGVDLDFPLVWRAEAGLDQVAQAAGRCNREGLRTPEESLVTVFRSPEHRTPRELAQRAGNLLQILEQHPDLLSPDAIEAYFRQVYWHVGEDNLDARGVMAAFLISAGRTSFNYRSVAESFRMIESGLKPVIVARDRAAQDALGMLASDAVSAGAVARRLQPYLVQVPPLAFGHLRAAGHIEAKRADRFGDQFTVLRNDSLYGDAFGLLWEDADYLATESLLW